MTTMSGSNRGGSDNVAVGRQGGGRAGWELRLGAFQAVVWIGLALGAMAGAYFVGFFSGRYVGFDTARSVSAVEVAKLTVPTDLLEQAGEGVSDIYNRLNSPAGDAAGRAAEAHALGAVPAKGAKITENNAARIAQEMRAGAGTDKAPAKGEKELIAKSDGKSGTNPSEGSIAASEIDSLFEEDAGKLATHDDLETVEGRPSNVVGEPELRQKGVRVLGGESPANSEEQGSTTKTVPTDNSLGAILEERVARAREGQAASDNSKAGEIKAASTEIHSDPAGKLGTEHPANTAKSPATNGLPTTAGAKTSSGAKANPTIPKLAPPEEQAAEVQKREPPATDGNFVKQVLPQGFFAQVAAPKRIAEAQDVARRLKRSGFPVVIETAHVRGEDYFRVLVGPEENKVQADRLVDQLKREAYLSGSAFLRRVN